MRGRWNGIRGRGPVGPRKDGPRSPVEPVEQDAGSGAALPARVEITQPAVVEGGQTVSRTPCHERRVRIARDVTGRSVVVRCPFCSQLWEVHVPPVEDPAFALWVT